MKKSYKVALIGVIASSGGIVAPTIQSSNILFDNLTDVSMDIAVTSGKGAKRAIFMKAASIGFESLDNQPFAKAWNDSVSKKIQVAYKDLVIS